MLPNSLLWCIECYVCTQHWLNAHNAHNIDHTTSIRRQAVTPPPIENGRRRRRYPYCTMYRRLAVCCCCCCCPACCFSLPHPCPLYLSHVCCRMHRTVNAGRPVSRCLLLPCARAVPTSKLNFQRLTCIHEFLYSLWGFDMLHIGPLKMTCV